MEILKKISKINFVAFMQGLTLLIIALLMTLFFTSLSLIYTLIFTLFTLRFQTAINNFGSYMGKMALSIDQFGNVSCGKLLQKTLTKKDGHLFGDEDDTVSYVLGRNKMKNKLTILGKFIVWILNKIETNHVEIAIERKIERDHEAVLRFQENEYFLEKKAV